MTAARWCRAATAVLLSVVAAAGCAERAEDADATPALIMPTADDAGSAVALSFGFVQHALVVGDVTGFARNFTDSARMYVPGYGEMVGPAIIARDFGGEGRRLGIREIQRVSDGRYVDGREVVDSGRYVIVTERPLPDTTLHAQGRYWTRWRYTEDGRWLIMHDSIAGNSPPP
jgi:ketosteroid isomerase-like protein